MTKKILIVDDDPTYRLVTEKVLKDKGYEVATAKNGKEGSEKAETLRPDLIILDMIMPKQHGLSALDEIKKNDTTKNIPIIVWTNFVSAEHLVKKKDIAGFVVKSETSNDELANKVEEIINHKR